MCVLQVRGSVDDAAMPADVSGTFAAERRTHLSRVVSSCGVASFFAARCAATRQRVEQKRARCECLAPRCSVHRSHCRVFMGLILVGV
ncbi:hypothetical protein AT728_07555 [Streptomyces silvensis]|uniref:Uncharacterized protein n=1 Tax=Streptomyces silvensis TaxID=1765722 RepID=A0A0W7X7W0_9ACTN|nr:hypothetical protein AT728_07555 [Streptomyces silvensis]